MTTINVVGNDGADGADGVLPGDGSGGDDAALAYGGATNASLDLTVAGGNGGAGGNATTGTQNGGAGGEGGDATAIVSALAFAPPTGDFQIAVSATGGDAGFGGSGTGGGATGAGAFGGDANAQLTTTTVTLNSGDTSNVEISVDAAVGANSDGSQHGDATALIDALTLQMDVLASGSLTLAATATGAPFSAPSHLNAIIENNSVQGIASGMDIAVSLTGTTLDLSGNDFNLSAGDDDIVITLNGNGAAGSSLTFDSNTFDGGGGVNTLSLTFATALLTAPVAIDLAAETISVNGGGGSLIGMRDVTIAYNDSDTAPAAIIAGDGSNNVLTTASGDDMLAGAGGSDTLAGGDGNDELDGGSGADALQGGAGDDTASYANSSSGLTVSLATPASNTGEAAGDTFASIENITGSNFSDTLTGNSASAGGPGVNTLQGMGGDDLLIGDGAGDALDGGTGTDTASYQDASSGVTASLDSPGSNTGDAAGDSYISIENLTGSNNADTLAGDADANTLSGLDADDTLEGGAGGDALVGGTGIDTASYEHSLAAVIANLTSPGTNTGEAAGDSYSSIENLTGSAFADSLIANGSANTLEGLSGNDVLEGSGGADVLDGGSGGDSASYAHAASAVTVDLATPGSNTGDATGDTFISIEGLLGSAFADTLRGNNFANTLEGGGGADTIDGEGGSDVASYAHAGVAVIASLIAPNTNTGDAAGDSYLSIEGLQGSAFDDQLSGDDGNNTLAGLDGDDILIGGKGGDTMNGGDGIDTASYVSSSGPVTANLSNTGLNTGDAVGDRYTSIENLTGTAFSDSLTGNSGDNVLMGGAGPDSLNGLGGNDTASYANATTGITASLAAPSGNTGDAKGDTYASIENLTGSNFDDKLTGNSNANVLIGLNGNDELMGRVGADALDGGNGIDTASYKNAASGVTANLNAPGANTGEAAGDTYVSIENLIGSNFADTLTGNSVNNMFTGGLGADAMSGLGGNDTANYADATAAVTASLIAPSGNTGEAAGDTYSSIENIIGSDFDDVLTGNGTANALTGGKGKDVLEGRTGGDALDGGNGNDTATYANALTAVAASLVAPGTNSGEAGGDTYVSIENLTGSSFNDTLAGNSGANRLIGGAGDDLLVGHGGIDIFTGNAGSDTVSYSDATAGLSANLATPSGNSGEAAGDSYNAIENLIGSAFNDTLIGTSGVNTLTGLGGNDMLQGRAGGDVLDGGSGIDTVNYANANAGVVASLVAPGSNTGEAAGDSYISIERLVGTAFADVLTGTSGTNALSGLFGDDMLVGGAGGDALDGGTGNDTASYAGASASVVADLASSGVNTGDAAGDTYVSIENLVGTDFSDILRGNATDNILTGGAGPDTLNGRNGNDSVSYFNAAAAVTASLANPATNTGDATGDTYTSIENLTGSAFDDTLTGDSSVNKLNGLAGDDMLQGRAGGDAFNGGAGSDTVSYQNSNQGIVASLTTPSTNTGEAAGDTYTSIENLTGTTHNDTLTGNNADNRLIALDGDDNLYGLGGDDFLRAGLGTVQFYGGNGDDTVDYTFIPFAIVADLELTTSQQSDTFHSVENLTGTNFGDTFKGTAGDNKILGRGGDDNITGREGADLIDGGAGHDTANYSTASTGVTVSLTNPSINTGDAAGDTFVSIENLTGSAFNDFLIGESSTMGNQLRGGAGDDILAGIPSIPGGIFGNNDWFVGGSGNDTVTYEFSTIAVTASLADSFTMNRGGASGDDYTGIENLTGSSLDDHLIGDNGSNTLKGLDGDDVLIGGAGGDALDGGMGTDIASYENETAGIVVNLANPASSTGAAAGDTYTSIEGLRGTNFNDTLIGDNNNNVFTGGGGADSLNGAGGNDTVDYSTSAAGLTVSLATPSDNTGNAAGDSYSSIENISGSRFDDVLVGNSNNNKLTGLAGDDLLNGGGGIDHFDGSGGNDTVTYANASGGVHANLAAPGSNTGDAAGETYASVENLIGTAFTDALTGDNSDNRLMGGAGGDALDGGNGDDTASYANAAGGVTANLASPGNNSGDAAGDSYISIENLEGSKFDDTLTGDGNDNHLMGGSGADALDGGGGSDTADYANATGGVTADLTSPGSNAGDADGDSYNSIENLSGSAFDDTLIGTAGVNVLTGGNGNDILKSNGGADTMIGGAGADQLIAGNGAQTFVYAAASEATGLGFDTITNFDAAVDTFDLPAAVTGIDAAITTGSLSTNGGAAYFDLFLQVAITTLAAHHAVLFTPDGGDAAGETFLIVDMNGTVGYQVAEDMVFLLDNASNLSSLGSTDFI